jgi:hypothetical protein
MMPYLFIWKSNLQKTFLFVVQFCFYNQSILSMF